MDVSELCDVVRQTAYNVLVYHKNGYWEKIYENGRGD